MVEKIYKILKMPFTLLGFMVGIGAFILAVDHTIGWKQELEPLRDASVKIGVSAVAMTTPVVQHVADQAQKVAKKVNRSNIFEDGLYGLFSGIKAILVNWLSSALVPVLVLVLLFAYREGYLPITKTSQNETN